MTDKKAYVTLREATQEAEKIAQDPAIPLWKKAHLMGIPFTKIALNALKPKDRDQILMAASLVNEVTSQYQLESFEEYQKISDADLKKIVSIFRSMSVK